MCDLAVHVMGHVVTWHEHASRIGKHSFDLVKPASAFWDSSCAVLSPMPLLLPSSRQPLAEIRGPPWWLWLPTMAVVVSNLVEVLLPIFQLQVDQVQRNVRIEDKEYGLLLPTYLRAYPKPHSLTDAGLTRPKLCFPIPLACSWHVTTCPITCTATSRTWLYILRWIYKFLAGFIYPVVDL